MKQNVNQFMYQIMKKEMSNRKLKKFFKLKKIHSFGILSDSLFFNASVMKRFSKITYPDGT